MRLLQNYADGTGRGRLSADSNMREVLPIRGLLVSTGEDFPMHSPSGLARSVIVNVPNQKDFARARRCQEKCPLYRGLMADFIAHLIREQKKGSSPERVDHWYQYYHAQIAGRQNDARIAGNHSLLAAAFEQFAAFLGDVWPEWETEAREFAEEDLLAMVMEAVGSAEEEQASTIFLETLRSLIEYDRVWVEGLTRHDPEKKQFDMLIGRVANPSAKRCDNRESVGAVLELNIPRARRAVQKSLKEQGKPELPLGDQALIEQLATTGLLLDEEGNSIMPGQCGSKTRQVRILGTRMRTIRIRRVNLLAPASVILPMPQQTSLPLAESS